jgi:uncharacterized protein (DUF2249 family)
MPRRATAGLIQLKALSLRSGDDVMISRGLRPCEGFMSAAFNPVQSEGPIVFRFDACGIARRFRQAAIVAALDMLRPGETMRFVNDHDSQTLLDQVAHRYGNAMLIRHLERASERVVIDFERH